MKEIKKLFKHNLKQALKEDSDHVYLEQVFKNKKSAIPTGKKKR